MKAPSVRKKCQRNSSSYWRNEIIKKSMINKSNDTKLKSRIDKSLASNKKYNKLHKTNKFFKSQIDRIFDD
jgi:hypothetical protein